MLKHIHHAQTNNIPRSVPMRRVPCQVERDACVDCYRRHQTVGGMAGVPLFGMLA